MLTLLVLLIAAGCFLAFHRWRWGILAMVVWTVPLTFLSRSLGDELWLVACNFGGDTETFDLPEELALRAGTGWRWLAEPMALSHPAGAPDEHARLQGARLAPWEGRMLRLRRVPSS